MSMLVFRVVTPCGLVGKYKHFGETNCLHLQGWKNNGWMERRGDWKSEDDSDIKKPIIKLHITEIKPKVY
jgi:hypothetical protein